MQIVLSQCTLMDSFFFSFLANRKEMLEVWLLILEGKRTVTAGSPCESSLKDRSFHNVECCIWGKCFYILWGHIKK